jgi:hypothetical protein
LLITRADTTASGVPRNGPSVCSLTLLRLSKAVRNPAKSALLARMAAPTGRGRGFAVHKAPDQVGRSAVRCC